jgi:hypothetical protein
MRFHWGSLTSEASKLLPPDMATNLNRVCCYLQMQTGIASGLLVGYLIMYQILWFLKSTQTKFNHETQMSITCMTLCYRLMDFKDASSLIFFHLKMVLGLQCFPLNSINIGLK